MKKAKQKEKISGKYNYRTLCASTLNNVYVVKAMQTTENECNQKCVKITYKGDGGRGKVCVCVYVISNVKYLNLHFPGRYVNISKNDKS